MTAGRRPPPALLRPTELPWLPASAAVAASRCKLLLLLGWPPPPQVRQAPRLPFLWTPMLLLLLPRAPLPRNCCPLLLPTLLLDTHPGPREEGGPREF